jgi:hypothetical protein
MPHLNRINYQLLFNINKYLFQLKLKADPNRIGYAAHNPNVSL